jgi:hypothetical protein
MNIKNSKNNKKNRSNKNISSVRQKWDAFASRYLSVSLYSDAVALTVYAGK